MIADDGLDHEYLFNVGDALKEAPSRGWVWREPGLMRADSREGASGAHPATLRATREETDLEEADA